MYTCSKFRKSYTPPAAQIRVKQSTDHGSFEHNRTIKTGAKNRQIYIFKPLYKGSNKLTECMLHQYAINISAEKTWCFFLQNVSEENAFFKGLSHKYKAGYKRFC
jgi:hypothetical protein